MGRFRKVVLALALVTAVLVGGVGPMGSPAVASHYCFTWEGTNWNDPSYGPHWEWHADGWWYYRWWEHWEECEGPTFRFLSWHQHWTYYGTGSGYD